MILLRTWSGIARHWHSRRYEWGMGASAFAMGAALTLQPDLFDKAPHYVMLEDLADESTYAVLFYLCATFRFVALGINGTFAGFRFSPHLRSLAALLGALLWGWFSFAFMLTAMAHGTSYGPIVAYGTAAMIELTNVRTASAALGAWVRERT